MLELINRRQRQILIHSCIYYELNENIISDLQFDAWCKELVELKSQHIEDWSKSVYADVFKEFDGSSGAFLHYRLLYTQAVNLLRIAKKVDKENLAW